MIRCFLIFLMTLFACRANEELLTFPGCVLVPTEWSDGDSFSVRFPDGKERTVRLYGADCIEMHINGDDSNARRLRDQRRYFGIDDILTAKSLGEAAKVETCKLLAKPFTVVTAFADGRGDERFERVYGFVETSEGKNLSEWLVSQGLARAFGVVRQLADGTSGSEWKDELADLELTAAQAGRGAWAKTDWKRLVSIRKEARAETAELQTAKGTGKAVENKPVDLNHATRNELMTLPGIGEKTAVSIIQARPFQSPEAVKSVKGMGASTYEKIKAFIHVTPP